MEARKRNKLPGLIRSRILQLGLAQRATAVVSVGFLALYLSIGALGEHAVQDSSSRLREERLTIAKLSAGEIDRLMLHAIVELDQVQRMADLGPGGDVEVRSTLLADAHRWLTAFSGGFFLIDSSGQVVVSQPPGRRPPVLPVMPVGPSSGVTSSGGARLSEPFLDTATNRPTVAVFAPIWRDGKLYGLLVGQVALDSKDIRDVLREAASLSETGHAVLIDGEGRTLAATQPMRFLAPAEHPSFYRRVLAGGVPVVETVPVDDPELATGRAHRHVMAVAPLRVATWAVAVGDDEQDVLAGVSRLRWGLGLVGAVALVTAWAITIGGTRRLVRPVQRLTEAAERIAAGDLNTPLTAPEGGEIGAMAVALDSMREQLLESITELGGWNEALEARVDDRTRALRQEQALTQSLLRRVITAQEEERGRVSADLHDGIGQSLTGVQLSIDRVAKTLPADGSIAAKRLRECQALVDQALQDLRRMIAALRPGVLDQLGLVPALQWVADHTLRANGIAVSLEGQGLDNRLPREIETILFRIGQEAMSNVVRHSGAQLLNVRIQRQDAEVRMTLTDDGRGFATAAVAGLPDPRRGLGLAGMNERASAAGGSVVVVSAPGSGTVVRVVVPLPGEAAPGDVDAAPAERPPMAKV